MVAADRPAGDTIVRGELTLVPTDSVHRFHTLDPYAAYERRREPEFLLAGWTTVDPGAIGAVGVVVSPASRDLDSPGVQVDRRGDIVIGNPITPKRGPTLDAGILLFPRHIDDTGFSGAWLDGSPIGPTPHGYFCAVRRASERAGSS